MITATDSSILVIDRSRNITPRSLVGNKQYGYLVPAPDPKVRSLTQIEWDKIKLVSMINKGEVQTTLFERLRRIRQAGYLPLDVGVLRAITKVDLQLVPQRFLNAREITFDGSPVGISKGSKKSPSDRSVVRLNYDPQTKVWYVGLEWMGNWVGKDDVSAVVAESDLR